MKMHADFPSCYLAPPPGVIGFLAHRRSLLFAGQVADQSLEELPCIACSSRLLSSSPSPHLPYPGRRILPTGFLQHYRELICTL